MKLPIITLCVAQKAGDVQSCDNTDSCDMLNTVLLESSQATLPRCHPEQKKDFISKEAWDLLEKRWEAISNQDSALAETLSKDITKRVRIEKEQHLLNELEAINQDGYKWDRLKKISQTHFKFYLVQRFRWQSCSVQ